VLDREDTGVGKNAKRKKKQKKRKHGSKERNLRRGDKKTVAIIRNGRNPLHAESTSK